MDARSDLSSAIWAMRFPERSRPPFTAIKLLHTAIFARITASFRLNIFRNG